MSFTLPKLKNCPNILGAMTPFPYSVQLSANAKEASAIMEEHGFHHLPVIDSGALVGVITHRDIEVAAACGKSDATVLELHSKEPYIVDAQTKLSEVVARLAGAEDDVALVTRDNKLVGIFTSHDAFRILGEMFSPDAASLPDEIA